MNNEAKYIGFFAVHSLYLNYAVFGGLFSNTKTVLWIHALVCPLTILHWNTNNGACFLTELEQKLVKNTKYEKWVEKYPLFTQRYLSLFGISLEEQTTEKMLRVAFIISWVIPLFKLFSLYQSRVVPLQPMLSHQNLLMLLEI